MYGLLVIGIRWETIGSCIKAIGLGRHMPALIGWLLVMSAGSTLKVTGKEIAAEWSITTTGTVIETGIIVRKKGIGTTTAGSKGGRNMRLACAIVLVVGLVLPARAQEERGWSFSGSFNGSSNSDGTVMKVAPMLGYKFNNHFQTYAGVPFYMVNVSSTATSTTTSTTPATSTPGGFVNGIGNAFVGIRLAANSDTINYTSTLELTGPTGDKTHGFSTGRATADWTNRFSHSFDSFTPFGSLGFANTISDTNFFVRPFTSLGLVSHFEGGGMYDISNHVRVNASAYAIGAVGNQTIISKVIKRQTALSVSSGTAGKASATAGANTNRVFDTVTQTVVPAQAANDHGVSTWIGVSPGQGEDFYIGYSRSMHYDFNTLFFGVSFRTGK
jgi:hypothetical protein